ncbi:hypothetical protein ACL6C3_16450 [Capilliphycus salinus ALCB114379]|uniref:hypothetical protein n=1 Tax=Capilliphycus salinus TaxID=2768948 RepID=UPI0039A6EC71
MKLYSAIALVRVGSIFISSVVLLSALTVNSQIALAEDSPQGRKFFQNSGPPTEPGGSPGEAGGGDSGSR